MVSYACHLFADKLNNITLQKELSRLNRIACLSLGSVPPSTPTATMGILLNLMPLDLEMEKIAIKIIIRNITSLSMRLTAINWLSREHGRGILRS
jgi:hypothetical protein